MFNGMMDPEMIRIAQEQMSRMSPAELARIQQQMMSNPDLLKMASEGMKNLRPEDLKYAAEQMKHTRPEEMAEIGEKMANATPEELAAMRARLDAQSTYEINAAQMLKNQGNELHGQGRYNDAMQKYLLAKKNLKAIPVSKGRALLLACSLNLMSCYLKTKQYDECVREGSEVLAYDANNVKALYRRGQAYEGLGQMENAVADLSRAHEVSPEDETIADVLRNAKERLNREGTKQAPRGLVIEEIVEEEPSASSNNDESAVRRTSISQAQDTNSHPNSPSEITDGSSSAAAASYEALKADPESIRSFQDFISRTDPETLAALGKGKVDGIPPDMLKTASNIIGKMSPEELQRMLQFASPAREGNPFPNSVPDSSSLGSFPAELTPDMLKSATDIMSKMSPEELQKMFGMASSLKERGMGPAGGAGLHSNGLRTDNSSGSQEPRESLRVKSSSVGESSSSQGLFSRSTSQSSPSTSTADLREQMRNQMNDPAMRQMFTSMMKNMSPEMMANMSDQFGLKLSREDAEKAQKAMSSLSPDDLEKMMKWAERIQKGTETVKKTKNWLLGRPGMILAIAMLLLAVILHRLGYIGN